MAKAPKAIRLFGTEEPLPERRELHAGPLSCTLEAGNLRHVRIGGIEAIRAIQMIVRDDAWRTYNPVFSDLVVDQRAESFAVSYQALCADDRQRLTYKVLIEGRADGSLDFSGECRALTAFRTNRTGFTVLHPIIGVSGGRVRVEHVDGTLEESVFPGLINPICPFKDIRALTHEVSPGVAVRCLMQGETFEMEDQRNWTDASYKTYCRPLALPWPYELAKGEVVRQSVQLSIEGRVPAATARQGGPIEIAIGAPTGRMVPPIGLGVLPEHAPAALERAALIKAAGPAHLMCRLDPRQGHGASELELFARLGAAAGSRIVLEAVLPCLKDGKPTADPAVLRQDLETLRQSIDASGIELAGIAISPAADMKCTLPGSPWPPTPSWADIFAMAREILPEVPIGGGMLAFFTELNRKRPPQDLLAFTGHHTCPIFHAGDDISMMEGLESLPFIWRTARSFIGDAPYWLFPTSIAMRENAYGDTPAPNPGNIRQACNWQDPRERAISGAAWYAAMIARASVENGPDRLTLAACTGPSGIAYAPLPHAQPWLDTAPGVQVLPHYHVLKGHMALAGCAILGVANPAPERVSVLATADACWLANLTAEPLTLALDGLAAGPMPALRVDEASFEALCRDPALAPDDHVDPRAIALGPYAVLALRTA